MPLFLLIFGALMIDAGMRKQTTQFFGQLKSDMSGFVAFGMVILILGGLGTIEAIRPITKGLLLLVFVAFFLKNGQNIVTGMTGTATAAPTPSPAPAPSSNLDTSNSFSSGSGNNGNNIFGNLLNSSSSNTSTGSSSSVLSGDSFSSLAGNAAQFFGD